MDRPDLLIRCGDVESARRAIAAGADWIAIGGEVSAQLPRSWGLDDFGALTDEAHTAECRVALVTDRITTDREMGGLRWLAGQVGEIPFDQILVSNLGAWELMHSTVDLPIWADFSLNAFNTSSCSQLAAMGFIGATVALETTYPQLITMCKGSPIPLEIIAHGSLTGMLIDHCLASSMLADCTPQDPCPAPCRGAQFALSDEMNQLHPLVMDNRCRTHMLQPRDVCTLRHLPFLIEAGVRRLRIEAQWDSAECAGVVTELYRRSIDRIWENPRESFKISDHDWQRLMAVSPRPFNLSALANDHSEVAQPGKEMPTNAIIRCSA